jgi:hypothetical protein
MVYFIYALLVTIFSFIVLFKYNKEKVEIFIFRNRKFIIFYLNYMSIFIIGVGASVFSAAVVGLFIPIQGVYIETLLFVKFLGIIIGYGGITTMWNIKKYKKRIKNG